GHHRRRIESVGVDRTAVVDRHQRVRTVRIVDRRRGSTEVGGVGPDTRRVITEGQDGARVVHGRRGNRRIPGHRRGRREGEDASRVVAVGGDVARVIPRGGGRRVANRDRTGRD